MPLTLTPARSRREPEGGWEARWIVERDGTIATCRQRVDVSTPQQFLSCALAHAFPSAAPWADAPSWPPWMREAWAQAEREVSRRIRDELAVGTPTAATFRVWLAWPRARASRTGARALAMQLFPGEAWPPRHDAQPWAREVWRVLSSRLA